MYENQPLIPPQLRQAHQDSWDKISRSGDFFSGHQRVEMVRVARDASTCQLCLDRKAALSPFGIDGQHNSRSSLSDTIVDMIHRVRSDPGRLTKGWFDTVTEEIDVPHYVEVVSVVTSAVIIETLHNALGEGLPALPQPRRGRPSQQTDSTAVDAGAWLPITAAAQTVSPTGLPAVPNIARALGLVPAARDLFFNTFRPHYALADIPLSITQSQAEFVAARVSAINECFY